MKTRRHIVTSIEGVLSRSDAELKADYCPHMTRPDGTVMTPTQLRTELCKMLAAGFEVLPGSTCDDYDATGRCKGHVIVAEQEVA